ncbi:hypothetical protein F4861DRAFT_430778 [Xylaria intraflava]|nr:hypothetical protein F4861DRAFT_430778 [Xylaria intraflava]
MVVRIAWLVMYMTFSTSLRSGNAGFFRSSVEAALQDATRATQHQYGTSYLTSIVLDWDCCAFRRLIRGLHAPLRTKNFPPRSR